MRSGSTDQHFSDRRRGPINWGGPGRSPRPAPGVGGRSTPASASLRTNRFQTASDEIPSAAQRSDLAEESSVLRAGARRDLPSPPRSGEFLPGLSPSPAWVRGTRVGGVPTQNSARTHAQQQRAGGTSNVPIHALACAFASVGSKARETRSANAGGEPGTLSREGSHRTPFARLPRQRTGTTASRRLRARCSRSALVYTTSSIGRHGTLEGVPIASGASR
jgi:hypothetical protein